MTAVLPHPIIKCEKNDTDYVMQLKENGILYEKSLYLVDKLDEITKNNKVDYTIGYGKLMYTFVVINMNALPEYLIIFYCE